MFAVVGISDVTHRPFVRFHSARNATALPSTDYDHSEGASGLAIGRAEVTPWSGKRYVPTVVNVFMPNKIIEIRQYDAARWAASVNEVPERSPMIVAFAHRPRGRQPFGKTRISHAVRGISNEMVRTMSRMEVLSAYYTMPQRYALGLTKSSTIRSSTPRPSATPTPCSFRRATLTATFRATVSFPRTAPNRSSRRRGSSRGSSAGPRAYRSTHWASFRTTRVPPRQSAQAARTYASSRNATSRATSARSRGSAARRAQRKYDDGWAARR